MFSGSFPHKIADDNDQVFPESRENSHLPRAGLLLVVTTLVLSGCQIQPRASSPDVKYSKNSSKSTALQVPPDLTDVSRGEQFVLPGDVGRSLARNTLLPGFESVRFVRNGADSWLESDSTPEDLWPRLLAFVRSEGFEVSRTQPLNGTIESQWKKNSGDSGMLKSLIKNDSQAVQRIGLRLERKAPRGSRLFARLQVASGADEGALWNKDATNPEQTSVLTQRLLIFLGIDEQKAKGLLNDGTASLIVKPATLQTTSAGSSLILHYGYQPSIDSIKYALDKLGMAATRFDSNAGQLSVADPSGVVAGTDANYTLLLSPLHVSAVSLTALGADGKRLSSPVERKLLLVLRDTLS